MGMIVQVDPRTLIIPVTIAAGQSLSAAIDTHGWRLVAIGMPAAWNAAGLTFQAAESEAGTFRNVYDGTGEKTITTADASRWVLVSPIDFAGLRFLKIRSGTAGAAVVQTAERVLHVMVRDL